MEGDVDAGLLGDGGIEIVVEIDDWNLHLVRLLEAGQQDGRIDRRGDHRHRLLLQHGVAGVELRLGRLVGFDRLQEDLDAGVLGPASTPFSIAPQNGLDSVFIKTP